jgi:hypothetical protein
MRSQSRAPGQRSKNPQPASAAQLAPDCEASAEGDYQDVGQPDPQGYLPLRA